MSNARRVIARCLLLGWLFAIGHVATEHGEVVGNSAQVESAGHGNDHHDGGPEHGGNHHHALTAVDAGQFAKAAEHKALAPVWVPLYSALVERLTAMLREAEESRSVFDYRHSPPDRRASGWLLVVRTALPVRGPSLA